MRLYLGCGPLPIHEQHKRIMGDVDEWLLIDKYVDDPHVLKWDARDLPVENGSVREIYSSHLLEHFSHTEVKDILLYWKKKLTNHGHLILNVPDLVWACRQVLKYESGDDPSGYYNTFDGEHGLVSVIYGSQSHDGEYHKSGYTKSYMEKLLKECGYSCISIAQEYEAHDMGCLIVEAHA